MKADVVIFDPATVADQAAYDKPHQYSVGFRDVIVNGKLALKNDAVTAERPGACCMARRMGSSETAHEA